MIRLSFRATGLLSCALLLATACTKPKDDIIELITGERPACGRDGARLSATINGDDWCADAFVRATTVDSALLVQATALSGRSLAITISDISDGTRSLSAEGNGVLFLDGMIPYRIPANEEGSLELHTDTVTGQLNGTLNVRLAAVAGNGIRNITARFQVVPNAAPSTGE